MVLKRHSSIKLNNRYAGNISGDSPYQQSLVKKDDNSSVDLDRLASSNGQIFSPNSTV